MIAAFDQVSKHFQTTDAVRDLSLTLPSHGIIAIMGPSGCGKTTILQMLAGLTAPSSGSITCNASQIAYVFQEPRLLPWRTVLDNVLLAKARKGAPPSHTATEWLEAVGLGDCIHRYPEELSGGMRQRVSIARALYCDSDLLLLDEPFHGLDEGNKQRIISLIREARRGEDTLTVMVTHDREEAFALADQVLVFEGAPASDYRYENNKGANP